MTDARKTHRLAGIVDCESPAVITAQSAKVSHVCTVRAGNESMLYVRASRINRMTDARKTHRLAGIVDISGPTVGAAESSKVSHVCPIGAGYKSTMWSARVVVPYDLAGVIDSETGTELSSKTPHTYTIRASYKSMRWRITIKH